MLKAFLTLLITFSTLYSAEIPSKIIVMGIARNTTHAYPQMRHSIESLGSMFEDYRVILYENNSIDATKQRYREWASENPKVLFFCEDLSREDETRIAEPLGAPHYLQTIAYARNQVLKEAMKEEYDDFPYLIMCDMDFKCAWPLQEIKKTILNPNKPWDAVFANGINTKGKMYDSMAIRSKFNPIGPELIGMSYYYNDDRWYSFDQSDPWIYVCSAFNGLGIYKREALKGAYYAAYPTKELEEMTKHLLEVGKDHWLHRYYFHELRCTPRTYPYNDVFHDKRSTLPKNYFTSFDGEEGQVYWRVYTDPHFLPVVCEHVTFHAYMWCSGFRNMYINPALVLWYADS